MKKINVRSILDPLSNKEMKLISDGRGDRRVKIWCIIDEEGTQEYVGEFNDCYFHFCQPLDGVLCVDVHD